MTQTTHKTELANKVIKKIMAGLTQDWLTKEVNRYLGQASMQLSFAQLMSSEDHSQRPSTLPEFSPLEPDPLRSFTDYFAKIDKGQFLPTLSIELSDGSIIDAEKILEELVGSPETVSEMLAEKVNIITWLKQHFPIEYNYQFELAESVADSSQVEARIRTAYAEAVDLAKTGPEGVRQANEQLGTFIKTFPQETCRIYFKEAIRTELSEERVRELVRDNELRRAILYTQLTHL